MRLLDRNRPMDPKLEAKVSQLLHVKLEGPTLSAEGRQALPLELRHLPVKEIEKLQEQTAYLVPENLRFKSSKQHNRFICNSCT